MHKTLFIVCLIGMSAPVMADGVSPGALSDPNVVPIVRGSGQGANGGPLVISEHAISPGYCHNSQSPGAQQSLYGYETRLACDHIVVGLGLLGGLYLMGSAAATN